MFTAARLGAVALTAAVLAGSAAPALAATASPVPVPAGLYGKSDPTYDGVWRQGLSLLALHTQGVTPADSAISWLTGQQCADGGWPSYNADPTKACTATTEDSNATSSAVQALVALGGHDDAVTKAVAWFRTVQNKDGGWSYNPGTPSDGNSTGLVVSALYAAKTDPATVTKDGKSALDGLHGLQLGCTAATAVQGAFAYQPDKAGKLVANDFASAQAALAAGSGSLPVAAPASSSASAPSSASSSAPSSVPAANCSDSKGAASQYLARQLSSGSGHLTTQLAGAKPAPDYAGTAWAALALANNGRSDDARQAVEWLRQNGASWAQGNGTPQATALALMILDARATGIDPQRFGTADLVAQLEATGPAPAATPAPSSSATASASASEKSDKSSNASFSAWWLILVGLAAGAGIGIYISYSRKTRTRPRP
ncbi:prenyltransferase/squalene oxidase repeat-containing protein [Streptacidiphilus sp. N1-3]|uniref:Prenyltransferase/squalene oxidase repeat-containing protein n=1 Tax=Streptacidiphilus alkalitolerans TaxID=3342712 RepID=A0ABV6WUJ7_9ACTN